MPLISTQKASAITPWFGFGNYSTNKFVGSFQIFIQVVLISVINGVAAAIYVWMQFVRVTEFLIILGQFMWFQAHGQ